MFGMVVDLHPSQPILTDDDDSDVAVIFWSVAEVPVTSKGSIETCQALENDWEGSELSWMSFYNP